MKTRRVLVELDAGGEVHGFLLDGEQVTVADEHGVERVYGPGLSLDQLPGRITPFDGTASDQTGPRCTLQLAALDLWGMREHVPAQSVTGRVFWWPEGEVLSRQHEVFRGVLRTPDFTLGVDALGRPAGSVTFTLAPDTRVPDRPFPPAAIGDSGRFPTTPQSSLPQAVPVIYGTVRGVPLYPITSTAVDPVRLLVAGHPIASVAVQIAFNGTAGPVAAIKYGIDGRGQVYAYVDYSKAFWDATGEGVYAVEVKGWAKPDGSLLDRLGDVLLHLWDTYSGENFYELDRRRAWGARDRLNRYRIGLLANEQQRDGTVLHFLAGRLANEFPVVFSNAGGRYGWDATVPVRRDGGSPAFHIIYGENAHDRTGPTETSVDDVITSFDLSYLSDGYVGGMLSHLEVSPANNGECRAAVSRWGASPVQRIDAPDIVDDGSAWNLLTDLVWWRTAVRRRVEYVVDDGDVFDLPSGTEVQVTDSECGWQAATFFVEALAPTLDGRVQVALVSGDSV